MKATHNAVPYTKEWYSVKTTGAVKRSRFSVWLADLRVQAALVVAVALIASINL